MSITLINQYVYGYLEILRYGGVQRAAGVTVRVWGGDISADVVSFR